MSPLHTSLVALGLTPRQAQIFLYCQEYGSLSVSRLAQLMEIPRTTIHGYVQEMLQSGFLTCTTHQHGAMYQSVSPDHLILRLREQQEQLEQQIKTITDMKPSLLSLSEQQRHLPKVRYYQWRESLEAIYKKFSDSEVGFAYFDAAVAAHSLWWSVEKLTQTFSQISGSLRELVVDNEAGRIYAHGIRNPHHQIKLLDPTRFDLQFPTDTICCDETLYYISYDRNMIVLEISHTPFYQSTQTMFDIIWGLTE